MVAAGLLCFQAVPIAQQLRGLAEIALQPRKCLIEGVTLVQKSLDPVLIVSLLNCELFSEFDKLELPNEDLVGARILDVVLKRLRNLADLHFPLLLFL